MKVREGPRDGGSLTNSPGQQEKEGERGVTARGPRRLASEGAAGMQGRLRGEGLRVGKLCLWTGRGWVGRSKGA